MKKKIFYLCRGFETNNFSNKKILFFHTPKCAGTTTCNLLSSLITKSTRIKGPLSPLSGFKNRGIQETSIEYFLRKKKAINNSNFDFVFGHIPYEISQYFPGRKLISMLRDPIDRSISHYNYKIQRNCIDKNMKIEDCFKKKLVLDNTITRQFCGDINTDNVGEKEYQKAKHILINKIDLVFDAQQSNDFLNLIISLYDFPNLLFQNHQVTKVNHIHRTKKNLDIISEYNQYDLKLYLYFKKNKKFSLLPKFTQYRKKNIFFYWSNNYLINNQRRLFLDKKKIDIIINKLKKEKYHICE